MVKIAEIEQLLKMVEKKNIRSRNSLEIHGSI